MSLSNHSGPTRGGVKTQRLTSYLMKIIKEMFSHQKPLYLRITKYACLYLGVGLGGWLFCEGFGICMVAGNDESSWVTTYVYQCLWVTMPMVAVGYFLPLLGGLLLTGNAIWSCYLLNQIWLNPISIGAKSEIFLVKNGLYDLSLTKIIVSGFLLLFGMFFLMVGITEWITFILWKTIRREPF